MMYTSQEGELYVRQRALGAIGVLPKQIQPTDVSKVLYQLKLIPDRRSDEQRSFEGAARRKSGAADRHGNPRRTRPGAARSPAGRSMADLRTMIEAIVREQAAASAVRSPRISMSRPRD